MYYLPVYITLCASRRQLKELYGTGSGLHRHHIIPKHSGGADTDDNFTYLTPREHIIAHFLLWKICNSPNDLRSMHMLGAKLSVEYRRIVGMFCRDNKLGIHGASSDERRVWQNRGRQTQKESGDTNSFYFWSTKEGRKKRAAMGGHVGGKKQAALGLGIHNPEVRERACSLGGKSHIGKVWVHRGDKRTRIQQSVLDEYLTNGWTRGTGLVSGT